MVNPKLQEPRDSKRIFDLYYNLEVNHQFTEVLLYFAERALQVDHHKCAGLLTQNAYYFQEALQINSTDFVRACRNNVELVEDMIKASECVLETHKCIDCKVIELKLGVFKQFYKIQKENLLAAGVMPAASSQLRVIGQ